jgi:hypothetical protein
MLTVAALARRLPAWTPVNSIFPALTLRVEMLVMALILRVPSPVLVRVPVVRVEVRVAVSEPLVTVMVLAPARVRVFPAMV